MRPAVRSRRGLRATLAHGIVFALILLFSAGAAIAQGARATAAPGPLVAAASDLRFALDELAAAFRRDSGTAVRIVYGSSGNFRRQIAEGAPFELFLSADEDYVVALAREGRLVDAGTLYGIGRLALVIPRGRRCAPTARWRTWPPPGAASGSGSSRSPIPSTRPTDGRRSRR